MPKVEPFVADISSVWGQLVIFHHNPLRSTLSDIQNNSDGVTVPSHVWATLGCVGGTGFNLVQLNILDTFLATHIAINFIERE